MKITNVVVTGGSGFLGSALIRELLKHEEYRVWNLSDKQPRFEDMIPESDRYTFIFTNLLNHLPLFDILPPNTIDVVYHLAGIGTVDRYIKKWSEEYDNMYRGILSSLDWKEDPSGFIESSEDSRMIQLNPKIAYSKLMEMNVKMTFNALEMARRMNVKKFFNISSSFVYSTTQWTSPPLTEVSLKRPNTVYGLSKLMTDNMVTSYNNIFGSNMETYNLRLPQMFGVFQPIDTIVPISIMKASRKEIIELSNGGMDLREWLDSEEAAEKILQVLENFEGGGDYNITGFHSMHTYEIATRVYDIVGLSKGFVRHDPTQTQQTIDYPLSNEKVNNELFWMMCGTISHPIKEIQIKKYNIDEQLRKVVKFYLTNYPTWSKIYDEHLDKEPLDHIKFLF